MVRTAVPRLLPERITFFKALGEDRAWEQRYRRSSLVRARPFASNRPQIDRVLSSRAGCRLAGVGIFERLHRLEASVWRPGHPALEVSLIALLRQANRGGTAGLVVAGEYLEL